MLRLFIAVPLPAEVKALLTALKADLPGARWVSPEQMHLTLHFLGDVAAAQLPPLKTLVSRLTTPPFPLTTGALGVFPTARAPRVLWLGLAPSAPLQQLHAELATGIADLGLPVEARPFRPHLTLARLRDTPPTAVAALLGRATPLPALTFTIDQVILYASTLSPGGATHAPQAIGQLATTIKPPQEQP